MTPRSTPTLITRRRNDGCKKLGLCNKCAEGLYDEYETFQSNPKAMNIIEVSKKYGAVMNDIDVMYEVVLKDGSAVFSKDELQAFADHFRKEGAEVENKALQVRNCELVAHGQDKSRLIDSLQEQLAATELVAAKMREYVVHKPTCKFSAVRDCTCGLDKALQLQPSISAMREHEAKVLKDYANELLLTVNHSDVDDHPFEEGKEAVAKDMLHRASERQFGEISADIIEPCVKENENDRD